MFQFCNKKRPIRSKRSVFSVNTQAGGFNVLLYHRAAKEATKNRPLDLGRLFARRRCFAATLYHFCPFCQRKTAPSVRRRLYGVIGNGGNRNEARKLGKRLRRDM